MLQFHCSSSMWKITIRNYTDRKYVIFFKDLLKKIITDVNDDIYKYHNLMLEFPVSCNRVN